MHIFIPLYGHRFRIDDIYITEQMIRHLPKKLISELKNDHKTVYV